MIRKLKNFYLHIRNKMQTFAIGLATVIVLALIWVVPIVLLGMAIKLVIYIVNL